MRAAHIVILALSVFSRRPRREYGASDRSSNSARDGITAMIEQGNVLIKEINSLLAESNLFSQRQNAAGR